MKRPAQSFHACLSLFLFFAASSALAQDDESSRYHPALSDKFQIYTGVFYPEKDFKIRVDGSGPGDEIDLSGVFNLNDNETTGALNFRWNFGEKWSFWGQYWKVSDSNRAELTEDRTWEDVTFQKGSFIEGGFDTTIARAFFGRSFLADKPNQELGIGAGFHWLDVEAYLDGEVLTSVGDIERRRVATDAAFPLPNIGVWYHYSWSRKWMVGGRLDWLSASIDEYSGGLLNAQAGVSWAPWRHVGFGLHYTWFRLDVDVDKSSWRGSAESTQYGPMLSAHFNW